MISARDVYCHITHQLCCKAINQMRTRSVRYLSGVVCSSARSAARSLYSTSAVTARHRRTVAAPTCCATAPRNQAMPTTMPARTPY